MFKNILISFVIIIISGIFGEVSALTKKEAYQNSLKELKTYESAVSSANNEVEKTNATEEYNYNKANTERLKEEYENSPESAGDITSAGYTINVEDISPGMGTVGSTTKENVNFLLATIIQNMMIALGSLALIVMTAGAGYIILHNGQDELLNKGKTIFMSGVYALIIALSSYYLVSIVRYLLYFRDN